MERERERKRERERERERDRKKEIASKYFSSAKIKRKRLKV